MIEGTCTECASHGATTAPVDMADFTAVIDAALTDFTADFDTAPLPASGTGANGATGPVVFA